MDPACGTGGFLSEAMMTLAKTGIDDKKLTQWAHYKLFGVDRDKTNVKLTRALMVGIGDGSTNLHDGSTNIHHGDSLRESKWEEDFNGIQNTLKEEDIQLC
ncbi:N-6 DNA methylase [Streptococcus parasanguinis]